MTFAQLMRTTGVKPLHSRSEFSEWRGCKKKIRYEAREEANKIIEKMKKVGELHVYPCSFCGNGFHIGHDSSIS